MTTTAARPRRALDDRGYAMPTAILLIMICGALSVLMLGVITTQIKPTMFNAKNSRTIAAAEAGVDASLSLIRNVRMIDPISTMEYGNPAKLPCTVTGSVGGGATTTYKATIRYFDVNPSGKSEAWRAANQKACSPTSGVATAPMFALIVSEGLDAGVAGYANEVGDRTLETMYTFQLTNDNIEGGAIYSHSVGFCLEATGTTVGSKVRYVDAEKCSIDDPLRMWSWKADYSIHLAITDTTGYTPLCIAGRPGSSGAAVDATLQICNKSSDQLFAWEGGAVWKVQNSSKTGHSNYCLGTGSSSIAPADGRALRVGACGSNASWSSFDPDSRVGAGAASKATNQIVNYLEFGRCTDVTDEDVNKAFMIVYPCKQDPSEGRAPAGQRIKWNHLWYYSEPADLVGSTGSQRITVQYGGRDYCLTTTSTSGGYVRLVQCSSAGADANWSRTADAGVWAESWTFKDRYGRCLSLGDKYSIYWSKIIVEPCSGQAAQKWNAPPLEQSASLSDYREING